MRYFSYNEYDPDSPRADETGGYVETLSEEEVRRVDCSECVGIADEYDGVSSTIVSRIKQHFGVE